MRLDPEAKLFIGLKIDSKLREALAQATPGDRRYFDDPNSPYLRVISNAEEQWIGKLFDGGIPPSEIDDIGRNVISILNRIAPGARHSPSLMRIFSVDPTPVLTAAGLRSPSRGDDRDRDRD
jgi:hypothetical protein